MQATYDPKDPQGYGAMAKALVEACAEQLGFSFQAMRRSFGFRTGHNAWRRIVREGETPTKEIHAQFSLKVGGMLDRNLKNPTQLAALTSVPEIVQLHDLLDQCFRTIARKKIAGRLEVFRTSPELNQSAPAVDYAGPNAEDHGKNVQQMHHTAKVAKAAGDTIVTSGLKDEMSGLDIGDETNRQRLEELYAELTLASARRDWGTAIVIQSRIAAQHERSSHWNLAVPALEELLRAQKRIPDHVYQLEAHARLANAWRYSPGHYAKGRRLLAQLHESNRWKIGRSLDAKSTARIAEAYALVEIEWENFDAAVRALARAEEIRRTIGNPVGIGSVSYYRGLLEIRRRKWHSARDSFRECRRFWGPLGIDELNARLLTAEAKAALYEFNARVYQTGSPEERAVLAAGWTASSQAVDLFARVALHGTLFSERARAHQIRGEIALWYFDDEPESLRVAKVAYRQSLDRCFDLVLLGRANRALAAIASQEEKFAEAEYHAKIALTYFEQSQKSPPEERRDLKQLIGYARARQRGDQQKLRGSLAESS